MAYLTLQEVIDRINNCPFGKEPQAATARKLELQHRPEFSIPRIARIVVSLFVGA